MRPDALIRKERDQARDAHGVPSVDLVQNPAVDVRAVYVVVFNFPPSPFAAFYAHPICVAHFHLAHRVL
mgnify:CR=1 FL=1